VRSDSDLQVADHPSEALEQEGEGVFNSSKTAGRVLSSDGRRMLVGEIGSDLKGTG
jgi:hypothetical protein